MDPRRAPIKNKRQSYTRSSGSTSLKTFTKIGRVPAMHGSSMTRKPAKVREQLTSSGGRHWLSRSWICRRQLVSWLLPWGMSYRICLDDTWTTGTAAIKSHTSFLQFMHYPYVEYTLTLEAKQMVRRDETIEASYHSLWKLLCFTT